jgi:hypothetical protein
MRIRITRNTVALNRVVTVGEVLDESVGLDLKDAAELIRLGKAVEIQVAGLPPAADKAATTDPGQAGEPPRPTPVAWAAETAIEAAKPVDTVSAESLVKKARRIKKHK